VTLASTLRWALAGLAVLLAGCASPPRSAGEATWTSGRLSLRVQAQADAPERSFSAAFELRGDSRQGELNIQSPLGTRLLAATWAPQQARLSTPTGHAGLCGSRCELSRQALGEALPLSALPDWLAGRPWPQAPHETGAGGFVQMGWWVDLSRRADGWITARRESPPSIVLRVKLDESGSTGSSP
jgi:outer membrane lipoprotein LolB